MNDKLHKQDTINKSGTYKINCKYCYSRYLWQSGCKFRVTLNKILRPNKTDWNLTRQFVGNNHICDKNFP